MNLATLLIVDDIECRWAVLGGFDQLPASLKSPRQRIAVFRDIIDDKQGGADQYAPEDQQRGPGIK